MRSPALVALALLALPAVAGCLQELPGYQEGPTHPGELAADYLRPGYPEVEVVILAEDGASPDEGALEDARPVLEEAIGKPVTITLGGSIEAQGPDGVYTSADLRALEDRVRARHTGGSVAVVHALYLAGRYQAEDTIGVAYSGSSLAIFKGRIREAAAEGSAECSPDRPHACCPLAPAAGGVGCLRPEGRYVERSVLVHEVGHLLGLVNHGIPMVEPHEQTEDPVPDTPQNEGKGHSSNRESVMYWRIEFGSEVADLLSRGEEIPHRFDRHDLADLRAFARGG